MLTELLTAVAIVSVCLVIHLAGILLMAEWLLRSREYFQQSTTVKRTAVLIVALFVAIMFLHLIQTSLWAVFYYARNLFSDFETSLYFSMVSFTTIGYGDVLLPRRWRLLGVVEGFSGVLLCGISTAFMFAVINAALQLRLSQRSDNSTASRLK
jgi:hypothetical protein